MATSDRGFASMSKTRQREIAQMGGRASAKSRRGAAGNTAAAKRGGKNSHGGTR